MDYTALVSGHTQVEGADKLDRVGMSSSALQNLQMER